MSANAWYCLHFWEHYAFGMDADYLRKTAYPVMKEICEYWEDHLKIRPDGLLVVPHAWSPEHGPTEDGVSYSQEIVWDLFNNYVQAADALGVDKEYRDKIAGLRDKLVTPGIGSWGQLLEWMSEKNQASFDEKLLPKKDPEKFVQQLQKGSEKKDSIEAFVWNAFPEALRSRITGDPKDSAALAEGLNALVNGGSLGNQDCFRKLYELPFVGYFRLEVEKKPALVPWLNRYLLSEVVDLAWGGNTPADHHRHTSHLFAVYPGRQIGSTLTPKLAEAGKVYLMARGDVGDVREWSFAWRTALYARLRDGEAAHSQVRYFFRTTCPNLFGNHPPMQMDGDFGITAGIAEMLLQSHEGEINLLPAIPKDWSSGSVKGLRARGGYTVDITWQDGKVTAYRVASAVPAALKLRVNGEQKTITSEKNP